MPALRDFAQNYTSTTTDPLVVGGPDTRTNDLLVSMVSNDTNAGTLYWVGGESVASKIWLASASGTVYTDYTTAFNNSTASDFFVTAAAGAEAVNNAFYVGHTEPFNGLSIQQTAESQTGITRVWEYWNGAAWATLTTLVNGIIVSVTVGTHGLSFNPPVDWTTTAVSGSAALYYIRWRTTVTGTITTRITCTQGWIGRWNQIFSVQNSTTAHHAILFKQATSAEPIDYCMNDQQATNDTKNGIILAIQDTDTISPLTTATSTAFSYPASAQDSDLAVYGASVSGVGQSFAHPAATAPNTTGFRLSTTKFLLKKVGAPTGSVYAYLYTHSGTFGTSSIATTPILAKSNPLDISTLTTSYQLIEFSFPWYWQYWMAVSTNYVVGLEYVGGDASNYLHVGYDASAPTHAGNATTKTGATWTAQAYDLCFELRYFTLAASSSTAARTAMQSLTTERNNSMLLYNASNLTVSVPSIIEGPVTLIAGKDGASNSHADAISWGFKAASGATPTNVYFSALATGNSVNSIIGINPPATGASVIPSYCSADNSVYISPMTGAAYLTDSAPVTNTVQTVFGSTINGLTLTNSSNTTVTYADTGINTYHAMRNALGVVTAKTWSGNTQVIASRDLSNRNILFHIQPYLPVDIQTTDSVSLEGACGVAIGFASTNATAIKVWHVGGANTPWGITRHTPAVIHSSYSTPASAEGAVLQSVGSLAASAVINIGYFVSGKVVAPNWLMGSVWALDTTTVVGGNATYPIGIPGIVQAAAAGHERKSVIQQGTSQFMIFQPLQIGDGGTNPTYLKLDSTALEFPQQYNKAAKVVNYCSVDNVCSLTYYAGSGDTIIHKDSVISSSSKYAWGFNALSASGASYTFTGLTLIGAGLITLNSGVPLAEVTFNACDQITHPGNSLTSCVFTKSTAIANQGALYITGSTQAALQASINKLTSCTFSTNTAPSGALRIEYTGSASAVALDFGAGNIFTGNTKDIFWQAPASSPLTLNLTSGTNPSTYSATNSNTVTFNFSNTFTISNIPASAEVRIFKNSDQTELCGVEEVNNTTPSNCSISADPDNAGKFRVVYTHSNTSLAVYIVVCKTDYQFYRQDFTLTNTTQSLLVSLIGDRQYFNPP